MNRSFLQKEWQKKAMLIVVLEILLVTVICFARLKGTLQFLELFLFDLFLQLQPTEEIDERITIIGIDEEDIEAIGDYPISDRDLAQLLNKLNEHKPCAIGLDIIRNIPVEPGHETLVETFSNIPNLTAIEKAIDPTINPPPSLPSEKIGFSDVFPDLDGNTRRSLLGMYRQDREEFIFSFSFKLAQKYLEGEGLSPENGTRDRFAIRFGDTELPRFRKDSGGYVNAKNIRNSDVQALLNFRNIREKNRFRTLSFQDIKTGNFDIDWIRDRIVIIGIMAPSIRDFIDIAAIANLQPSGTIYGVEFHAHATSQIISAVLDGRPMLKTWSETVEYLWILSWAGLIIILALSVRSSIGKLASLGIALPLLLISSYLLLLLGWWIPTVPVFLILIPNGIVMTRFERYLQSLQNKIEQEKQLSLERKEAMEHVFDSIHSGPLQTLHILLTNIRDDIVPKEELVQELERVNNEIRSLEMTLPREVFNAEEILRLRGNIVIDLKLPLHELLDEVYRTITDRNEFLCFQTLKVKIPQFDPITPMDLSLDNKRRIGQFLEEALCNVGKHAKNVTRLTVIGKKEGNFYQLTVKDNGNPCNTRKEGKGTRQMKRIAAKIGGRFKRKFLDDGTYCELKWPLERQNSGFASLRSILIPFRRKN